MKFIKSSQARRSQNARVPFEEIENQTFPSNRVDSPNERQAIPSLMQNQKPFFQRKEEQIYEQQILDYLISRQETTSIDPMYFCRQPDLKQHMRTILLNWLVDVHIKYRLQPETLFLAINLIDTYLNVKVVYRTQLQLVGLTALWIAAKYEETYQVPKIANLILICDSCYTRQQIVEMQRQMIQVLDFDFLRTTSLDYLNFANRVIKISQKDYYLARYMLQISLFDVSMNKYTAKTIAFSIIFFINKLRKNQCNYNISTVTNITQEQLKPCARDICLLWRRIQLNDLMANLRNKFLSSRFRQVAKMKLSPTVPNYSEIKLQN